MRQIDDNRVLIEVDGGRTIENDAVYVLIGADAPINWLKKLGVTYVDRPHDHKFGATDQLIESLVSAQALRSESIGRVAEQLDGVATAHASIQQETRESLEGIASELRSLGAEQRSLLLGVEDSLRTREERLGALEHRVEGECTVVLRGGEVVRRERMPAIERWARRLALAWQRHRLRGYRGPGA